MWEWKSQSEPISSRAEPFQIEIEPTVFSARAVAQAEP